MLAHGDAAKVASAETNGDREASTSHQLPIHTRRRSSRSGSRRERDVRRRIGVVVRENEQLRRFRRAKVSDRHDRVVRTRGECEGAVDKHRPNDFRCGLCRIGERRIERRLEDAEMSASRRSALVAGARENCLGTSNPEWSETPSTASTKRQSCVPESGIALMNRTYASGPGFAMMTLLASALQAPSAAMLASVRPILNPFMSTYPPQSRLKSVLDVMEQLEFEYSE